MHPDDLQSSHQRLQIHRSRLCHLANFWWNFWWSMVKPTYQAGSAPRWMQGGTGQNSCAFWWSSSCLFVAGMDVFHIWAQCLQVALLLCSCVDVCSPFPRGGSVVPGHQSSCGRLFCSGLYPDLEFFMCWVIQFYFPMKSIMVCTSYQVTPTISEVCCSKWSWCFCHLMLETEGICVCKAHQGAVHLGGFRRWHRRAFL